MTKDQVISDIGKFYNYLSKRDAKYRRNFNRYCNNGARRADIYTMYDNPLSYLYTGMQTQEDVGVMPILNVIRSSVETLVSKVSQTKVRPFFNPVNGTYNTRKICRNAQQFFDEYYDKEGIYSKAALCLRDACVFEVGHIWADDEDFKPKRILPWEYYYDPAEANYGNISRCYVMRKSYPAIRLRHLKSATVEKALATDIGAKVEFVVFYDLVDKLKHYIVDKEYVKSVKIDYDCPPVATLYYSPPIKGSFSTSMADNLYTIQRQIDTLTERIHTAVELSPANTIFVPRNSDIKASMVNNEIGAIYEYQPLPSGGAPVQISTPRPIDPSYVDMLERFIQYAYQMEGVSQLSAQSKKPTGLNSGVALQTLEDVESERHEVILQNYIKFLMDVAKTVIEVFPDNADVLPAKQGRANVKWADIRKERTLFNVQFSASSSLSKDPKTKMEQIEKLLAMQIIDPDMASSLLEFPDLEDAYAVSTASYDAAQRMIERAIEGGDIEYYECVNLKQLYREIVNTLLRLDANDEDPEVLNNLVLFMSKVKADMMLIQEAANPQPEQATPAPPVNAAPPLAGVPPMAGQSNIGMM